jgi:hypothetical protein
MLTIHDSIGAVLDEAIPKRIRAPKESKTAAARAKSSQQVSAEHPDDKEIKSTTYCSK